eukprot:TRINITY_DN632_c0_g1_i10.p1 TRINITY_DN632_c0_g1~~TRINITY_DN632_c0_g1_i10.p1  ORF type:complete len:224 (+),score=-17.93 TRINITY_DN632_c0_g1_i10:2177-2848(+)
MKKLCYQIYLQTAAYLNYANKRSTYLNINYIYIQQYVHSIRIKTTQNQYKYNIYGIQENLAPLKNLYIFKVAFYMIIAIIPIFSIQKSYLQNEIFTVTSNKCIQINKYDASKNVYKCIKYTYAFGMYTSQTYMLVHIRHVYYSCPYHSGQKITQSFILANPSPGHTLFISHLQDLGLQMNLLYRLLFSHLLLLSQQLGKNEVKIIANSYKTISSLSGSVTSLS